jgi:hypothetical protein
MLLQFNFIKTIEGCSRGSPPMPRVDRARSLAHGDVTGEKEAGRTPEATTQSGQDLFAIELQLD